VSGRARIDDCTVGVVKDLPQRFAVSVSGCAQVLISRTTIRGSKTYNLSPATLNGGGLHVSASRLTLVDSDVRGAQGYSPSVPGVVENGGNGGPGVVAISDSHVVIAGCAMVRGGAEGFGNVPFSPGTDGKAGDGLVVNHSTVVVRGTPPDSLLPGFYTPDLGGTPGKSLVAAGASRVVVSGVNFSPMWTVSGDSVLLQPAVAEPYLVSTGGDEPGTAHALQWYGPEGVPALLGISLAPALVTLQGFDDQVWVDPGAPLLYLLPIVTAGQATPIELPFTMPAAGLGLEGTVAEAQAFFPTFPSSLQPGLGLATNAAQVIVRL
jgi:hypothetical protein